jgi:hypothetical protein
MFNNLFSQSPQVLPHIRFPPSFKYLQCGDNPIKLHRMIDTVLDANIDYTFEEIVSVSKKLDNIPTELLYLYDETNFSHSQIREHHTKLLKFNKMFYGGIIIKPLRKLLYTKIIEPRVMKKYHPNYLVEHLKEEDNLDDFLENW